MQLAKEGRRYKTSNCINLKELYERYSSFKFASINNSWHDNIYNIENICKMIYYQIKTVVRWDSMPTETQKNFKRQMKEYQKSKANNSDQVFSYIENDMISDYYTQKPKRRLRKTIPIGTILILAIYFGLRIYGSIQPLLNKEITINSNDLIATSLNNTINMNSSNSWETRELYAYIQKTDELNKQLNEKINEYNSAIKEYNENLITNKGYIQKVKSIRENIILLKSEIGEIEVVEGMDEYYNACIYSFDSSIILMEKDVLYQETGDKKYIKERKAIIDGINEHKYDYRAALLKRFDELGIKYSVLEDGTIRYYINN